MTRIFSAHPQWSVFLNAYTNLGWESSGFHKEVILTLATTLWNIKFSTTCHLSPGTIRLWYTLSQDYLVTGHIPHHTYIVLWFNIQAQANIEGPQCTSLLNVSQSSPTSPKCRCLMLGIPHRTGDLSIHFSRDLQLGFIVEHFTRYLHGLIPNSKMLSQSYSIFSLLSF